MNYSVSPLWEWGNMPIQTGFQPAPGTETAEGVVNPFTDIFKSAIDAVKETDKVEKEYEYLMSTGQLDNPTELLLAANKAQLSVNLLTQLRSKAMDAYNELTRINL